MKTVQRLQLVSYEQAKRLKELNFDWATYAYQGDVNIPTVCLALKWARDVKGIHFDIKRKWSKIHDNYVFVIIKEMYDHVSDTYDQAESELLSEILKILEQK